MKMRKARRAIIPFAAAAASVSAVPAIAHPAAAQTLHNSPQTTVRDALAAPRSTAHAEAMYALVRVRPGDTMSGIAQARCGSAADWTGIFAASRALHLTGPDANLIEVGQMLAISCRWVPAYGARAGTAVVARHYTVSTGRADRWDGQHNACGDGDGDGFDMPCSYLHGGGGTVTYQRPAYSYTSHSGAVTYAGGGGCQSVIIRDESGGNARAVNPSSGAGGLYQFLPSTWHALGHSGLPQDASVAEQNQAYYQQVAQSGYTAWDASGGCRLWWPCSAGAGACSLPFS